MELECHRTHTEAALKLHEARAGRPLEGRSREQIHVGATANDLCELTNESRLRFHRADAGRSLWNFLFRREDSGLYQSHEGPLSTLHCMSKNPGEPAANTRIDVLGWFSFLGEVATGRFVDASLPLRDLPPRLRVGYLFEGTSIRLQDLMDSCPARDMAGRALGMMLHILEDSCTPSHCERDPTLPGAPIVRFFHYGSQAPMKHKKGDSRLGVPEPFLHEMLRTCIEAHLSGASFDAAAFFQLSSPGAESGGGPWVRAGWFDR